MKSRVLQLFLALAMVVVAQGTPPAVTASNVTDKTSRQSTPTGNLTDVANVSFPAGSGSYRFETELKPRNWTGAFSANPSNLSARALNYFTARVSPGNDGKLRGYGAEKRFTTLAVSLVSIAVTPANSSIAPGQTQQFTARGSYTDNSTANITGNVIWSSSNTAVATIFANGLAMALAEGTTTITATQGAITGSATLIVRKLALVSLTVTPAEPQIPLGWDLEFRATATYADNKTEDVTSLVTWSSSNTTVATIGAGGLATSLAPGITTIKATLGNVSGSTTLRVRKAELLSIAVSPSAASVVAGNTKAFTVTGNFTNNVTADLTTWVLWSSSNTSIASVQDIGETSPGLATGLRPGTAVITAAWDNISGNATLTVTPAVLGSITVAPTDPTIGLNASKQFRAVGAYSDGSMMDITTATNWASTNTTVATISTLGLATAVAAGTTNITTTLAGVSSNTTLTVTSAKLQEIWVWPFDPSIRAGQWQRFWAFAHFSDDSWADVSDNVTWVSSNTTVAWINPAGIVTSYTQGTSNITATSGNISGNTTLNVNPAILESITVTPIDPTVVFTSGAPPEIQFFATGVFSDGATVALTANATWSSNSSKVATVRTTPAASPGLASTVGAGTATITATYGFVSGSSYLTVLPDTVAPVVTLNRPTAGLMLGSANLTVSGNVDDVSANTTIVVNNGTPIPVTLDARGNFSRVVTLSQNATRPVSNTVLVTAVDGAGNIGISGTITVVVDARMPSISINQPAEEFLTNNSSLTVSGTITGAGTANLTLNGVSHPISVTDGTFTANVTLTEGTNIIVVTAYATGREGQAAYFGCSGVRRVTLDTTPPAINIVLPRPESIVYSPRYGVLGYVSDFDVTTVNVTLNGGIPQPIPVSFWIFFQNLALLAGNNTITIDAMDKAGNLSTATVTVIFDRTRPMVVVTDPLNNWATNVASQLVSGFVTDPTIPEATLYLNGQPEKITVAPDGSFARMVTLRTGVNTIEVRATDATGYTGTSGVLKVPLDMRAPLLTIGLSDPADSIIVTVNSDEPLFLPPSVIIGIGDTVVGVALFQWSGIFQPIPPGEYTVFAVAMDWAGNLVIEQASFTKQLVTIAKDETGEVVTESAMVKITPKADIVNTPVAVTSTTENPSGNVKNPVGAPLAAGTFLEVVTSPELQDAPKEIYIRVDYDEKQLPAGTDETTLKLYLWNAATGQWEPVPGSDVNTEENYVFGTTDHLSKYGTFGTPKPAPPPPPPPPPPPTPAQPAPAPVVVVVSPGVTDVSTAVTPSGVFTLDATAKSGDGRVRLDISRTTIGMTRIATPVSIINILENMKPPAPPAGANIVGSAYDLVPDGATFTPAITLTLNYDPTSMPQGVRENELLVAFWDGAQWVALPSAVDITARTVTAKISHFTSFAVIGTVPPPTLPSVVVPVTAPLEKPVPPVAEQIVPPVVREVVLPKEEAVPSVAERAVPPKEEAVPQVPAPAKQTNWRLIGGAIAVVIVGVLLIFLSLRRRQAR